MARSKGRPKSAAAKNPLDMKKRTKEELAHLRDKEDLKKEEKINEV